MERIRIRLLGPILVVGLVLGITCPAFAKAFNYDLFQKFLDQHLVADQQVNGFRLNLVDYQEISREIPVQTAIYNQLLAQFSSFDPTKLISRDEKLAFWINAYNLGAIKMIIDHFPVDSIRSRKINFLKNPWNKKVINIGGRNYSLSQIEHDILLDELAEPIAHFAIVCASLSCPDLSQDVYNPDKLQSQLAKQASLFLDDHKKGLNIDRQNKTVYFSQIFKFDKRTFPDGASSAVELISPYLSEQDRKYLSDGNYKIKYLDYNWDLNKR